MANKRIAVVVRDRQGEALRMSLGLLLLDDAVDVYVLDRNLEQTAENLPHLEAMKEFEVKIWTDAQPAEGVEHLPTEEIARRLLEYDHVLAY
jgi:hypothetical protein